MRNQSTGIWLALVGLMAWSISGHAREHPGACAINCDNALAHCEQNMGDARTARCPLIHQNCIEDCKSPPKEDRRTPIEREKAVCQQRCDLSEHQCALANPPDSSICDKGHRSCWARCDRPPSRKQPSKKHRTPAE